MRSDTFVGRLALGAVMIMFVASCAPAAPPAQAPAAATQPPLVGGTATVRIRGPLSTLELTTTQLAVVGIAVAQALYDTLVALDPDTAEPIPYLAKSWTQTPTSITF